MPVVMIVVMMIMSSRGNEKNHIGSSNTENEKTAAGWILMSGRK